MSESTKPSAIPKTPYIWMNGKFVDWDKAQVHVLTHVVHYGTGVFEGIRAYKTSRGPSIFRAKEHYKRILRSAKIYRMEVPYSADDLIDITKELIKKNGHEACYIRPVIYRGFHTLGVNATPCPVEIFIATWEWGKYLGPEALEQGVDVRFSSWHRMAPNTFPFMAKCNANYANSYLVKMEAIRDGYSEGITLNPMGYVSEGSGENLFLVLDGVMWTPCLASVILPGITRECVITLAKEMGMTVREEFIPKEMVYIADELFFTGTAAEITPIRSVDGITIGEGKRGPVAKKLQEAFFDIIEGKVEDRFGWHCYVK
jgi:branched-chain amino acid aminotransferase